MINIIDKQDCVGCNACAQRCPKQCISMQEDEQGFLYPKVDLSLCIDCHLCEKVCPVINQAAPRKPVETFAAKNTDEKVRMTSSSGGIFYALAKKIIEEGGVVFGAKFNDKWEVVHDYAETLEDVKVFQGSKYVQSRIGETFIQAEKFLKAGRKVMFTGTPCQIAALGLFLRKDYSDQLLKVDVVCHGVPSPLVWREYLKYITRPEGASAGKNTVFSSLKERPVITGISFRDKRLGWEKYGFSVRIAANQVSGKNSVFQSVNTEKKEQELFFEPLDRNLYLKGFLTNTFLRPSCYQCPSRSGKSQADISLADFWGIGRFRPSFYSKHGVSLVLAYNSKAQKTLSDIGLALMTTLFENALKFNPAIENDTKLSAKYNQFWDLYKQAGIEAINEISKSASPSLISRIKKRIKDHCKPLVYFIMKFIYR